MFGRDRWTIQTPFGDVELAIDEHAPPRSDEDFETDSVARTISYCIETRDPEVTKAVLDIFFEERRWQMPFGLESSQLSDEQIDAMRPELRRFVEHGVERGAIKLRDLETFIAATPQAIEVLPFVPPTEEKETFIGVIIVDQDDNPVRNSRVRIKLPDGDVKEGRTNSQGEFKVTGFVLDGMAEVTLIDFAPREEPEHDYDQFFVVVDEAGEPLVDFPYTITLESGAKIEGRTDKEGKTKKISSTKPEEATLEVFEEVTTINPD